jgi:hypothetical protein
MVSKRKENSQQRSGTTVREFFAAIRYHKPWPFGLRQPLLLAALKWVYVEWLHRTHFALRISDACQQRNRLAWANSA